VNLFGTPPAAGGTGEFSDRSFMDRPQLPHRLIPGAGDPELRHPLNPAGTDAGDRMQGNQKWERLRHPGTVTEALRIRQAGL